MGKAAHVIQLLKAQFLLWDIKLTTLFQFVEMKYYFD